MYQTIPAQAPYCAWVSWLSYCHRRENSAWASKWAWPTANLHQMIDILRFFYSSRNPEHSGCPTKLHASFSVASCLHRRDKYIVRTLGTIYTRLLISCTYLPKPQPWVYQTSKEFITSTWNISDLYSCWHLWCLAQARYKGLFTLDTRTEFNVHWSRSHFALTIRFGAMRIECAFNPIHLWRGGLNNWNHWNQIHCLFIE